MDLSPRDHTTLCLMLSESLQAGVKFPQASMLVDNFLSTCARDNRSLLLVQALEHLQTSAIVNAIPASHVLLHAAVDLAEHNDHACARAHKLVTQTLLSFPQVGALDPAVMLRLARTFHLHKMKDLDTMFVVKFAEEILGPLHNEDTSALEKHPTPPTPAHPKSVSAAIKALVLFQPVNFGVRAALLRVVSWGQWQLAEELATAFGGDLPTLFVQAALHQNCHRVAFNCAKKFNLLTQFPAAMENYQVTCDLPSRSPTLAGTHATHGAQGNDGAGTDGHTKSP